MGMLVVSGSYQLILWLSVISRLALEVLEIVFRMTVNILMCDREGAPWSKMEQSYVCIPCPV